MPDLSIRTRGGNDVSLTASTLSHFVSMLRGDVVTQESPDYEDVRCIWNGMVERRPALIVRCRSAADALHAVRFARDHDLLVAVRGGGHNIAGNALAEGGLVIDLAPMRAVRVSPVQRTARAEPGVLLGDFDRETQAFSLATPLGINSTTGIAGLTLGGGYGWLSRRHGLTIDNLRAADVVTADGELVTASERENSDLFWAIRGGGGNFGVVTSFEFGLHPVGPTVIAGLIVHPFDDAARLLQRYRDVMAEAPETLTAWVVMRKAPPLPFLPQAVHGQLVLVLAICSTAGSADTEQALRALRAIGKPHADVVAPTPYTGFQAAFDPLLAPGARNYWKSHNFGGLTDELIDVLVERVHNLPGPQSEIFLAHLGGAVSRKSDDATAYTGRAAPFVMNVHARWENRDEDERFVAWAREVYAATKPFAAAGAYVNFMTHDEQDRVRSAYGANYERLAAVKAKYDRDNLFRVNQNIVPSTEIATPRYRLPTDRPAEIPPAL